MPDVVVSIFKLKNDRGYFAPNFAPRYIERDTGQEWIITCGGSRAYFIRIGGELTKDFNEQSADSHFMLKRVTTSMLLGGCGLFKAEATGRLIFQDICTQEFNISTHLDLWNDTTQRSDEGKILNEINDWFGFICQNTLFRRAAEDAYAALVDPTETDFYLYRGMEWLLKAGNIGWRELADDIGVPFDEIKEFKRQVNVELGQRHGVESGGKRRAMLLNYGPFIADFIYGFCNVRKRVDKNFNGYSTEEVYEIVNKAMPFVPYP